MPIEAWQLISDIKAVEKEFNALRLALDRRGARGFDYHPR